MTIPSFSSKGKIVVVTGSRRNIGKAFALAFAEVGADVAVCDKVIEDGELEAVAKEIRKFGRRSLVAQVDVNNKTDVNNFVQRVENELGGIDILINNARTMIINKPLMEWEEEEWDITIDVDLKGYFLFAQAVAKRMMERRKGNIINIASRAAFKATKNSGAYPIAKAGVVMLTRMLAVELASYNIRVNAIAPCSVRSALEDGWRDPEVERAIETPPLGRWPEPRDIVGSALFLASQASSFITGHTILVDAGKLA
ncbi:MAG: SDR family oxidoreductase [Proteobacteria bacterium]|nr:SDR family oxidoreductase [Pseudomonadota bacterium]